MNDSKVTPVEAQAVPDLHQQIMNLPFPPTAVAEPDDEMDRSWVAGYKHGHRQARHAAAELVAASPAAAAGVPTGYNRAREMADEVLQTLEEHAQSAAWTEEYSDRVMSDLLPRVYDTLHLFAICHEPASPTRLTDDKPTPREQEKYAEPPVHQQEERPQMLSCPRCAAKWAYYPLQSFMNAKSKQWCNWCERANPGELEPLICESSPVAPAGAPRLLSETDRLTLFYREQDRHASVDMVSFLWGLEAAETFLSAQGCELATAATKQLREHSVHLAAPQNDQDFRDGQELPTAAPQVGEAGLQDIFRNPALLKMPGEEWEFDDDTAVKWAWFAHGQHTGMTAYFSGAQLRAAFNAGSQDFRMRPASSEAAP